MEEKNMKEMYYDAAIIGGGVIGCAIARELARYDLNVCLVEREEDVCSGTSKANSAIVHAGYDASPGSLKAKFNLEGSLMMEELSKELDFSFQRNGSLVLCLSEEDIPALNALYEKGVKNGVSGLTILSGDQVRAMEPNVTKKVAAALYAPTGGIVCPF
jgi:glycerol-3-phosphate dehydrogenase